MWQAVTWTFTFLVEILLSSVNLVIFSLLGGTSSILRTFLGGTSKKKHPVYTEERLSACELCAKAFSSENSLKIHMKAHAGGRPYQCRH